jgi:hypothetical protein
MTCTNWCGNCEACERLKWALTHVDRVGISVARSIRRFLAERNEAPEHVEAIGMAISIALFVHVFVTACGARGLSCMRTGGAIEFRVGPREMARLILEQPDHSVRPSARARLLKILDIPTGDNAGAVCDILMVDVK